VTLAQDLDDLLYLRNGVTPQTRGRYFEKWLYRLLVKDDLEPRTAFRPDGEEVDGSFMFRGQPYLLEAKWWKKEVPASAIYQFKGKVDGKLVGIIGVFVSMSGYSSEAVDALRVGKELNVILFDSDDIYAAMIHGFSKVLAYKLREAAERGEVFVPYAASTSFAKNRMLVVVESFHDDVIVKGIAKNLQLRGIQTRDLQILVARGVMGLANVASAAVETSGSRAFIFADYDGVPIDVLEQLNYISGRFDAVLVGQWSRKWLGLPPTAEAKILSMEEVSLRAAEIDVDVLAAQDPKFERLIRLLKS
jgi:hypothetical protein